MKKKREVWQKKISQLINIYGEKVHLQLIETRKEFSHLLHLPTWFPSFSPRLDFKLANIDRKSSLVHEAIGGVINGQRPLKCGLFQTRASLPFPRVTSPDSHSSTCITVKLFILATESELQWLLHFSVQKKTSLSKDGH